MRGGGVKSKTFKNLCMYVMYTYVFLSCQRGRRGSGDAGKRIVIAGGRWEGGGGSEERDESGGVEAREGGEEEVVKRGRGRRGEAEVEGERLESRGDFIFAAVFVSALEYSYAAKVLRLY